MHRGSLLHEKCEPWLYFEHKANPFGVCRKDALPVHGLSSTSALIISIGRTQVRSFLSGLEQHICLSLFFTLLIFPYVTAY